MIDVHCHLNFQAFEKDRDAVIKRAVKAEVTAIINTGTKIDSSAKAVKLGEQYDNLYAIVGIHPHHVDKLEKDWEQKLEDLARKPKVVGIGECGIDYYAYPSNGITDPNKQKDVFIKQIQIANRLKLPLQIHNRHAGKDILDILLRHTSYLLNPPGMFHCFSGDVEFLKKVLDLGFYIGFDGNITYKGLAKGETTPLKDLISYCPLDRILLETDSPYLTPIPHRGKRNEPQYVILVGEFIAHIKGVLKDVIKEQTTRNTMSVFALRNV